MTGNKVHKKEEFFRVERRPMELDCEKHLAVKLSPKGAGGALYTWVASKQPKQSSGKCNICVKNTAVLSD